MKKLFTFFSSLILFAGIAQAQPGALDPTFNPASQLFTSPVAVNGQNFHNRVVSIQQPDDKTIIYYDLPTYNGVFLSTNIIRITQNGALDKSFNTGTGVGVHRLYMRTLEAAGNRSITNQLVFNVDDCNIAIPDANFKAALLANAAINTNNDGEIQCTEATAYTGSINVSSLGITDLTGIEAFTGITNLDCSRNSLTNLNVTANTLLTDLICHHNGLTSLNISSNTALTYLDCSFNTLTSLNVSLNTYLTYIDCSFNTLTNLNVSSNTALSELHCEHDNLSSLDVYLNTALTLLRCGSNNLGSLSLSSNTALTRLFCEKDNLSSLDVFLNTALTVLRCSENNIGSLNVSSNISLTELLCQNDNLSILDVSSNLALSRLTCGYNNNLSNLNVAANSALTYLNCSFSNGLISLNLQNGQNGNLATLFAYSNPSLTCIQVDNVANADGYSGWNKDATASYSENCSPSTSAGAALSFDGVNDYAAVPNGGGLNNLQSGTIEMWVKWNGVNQGGSFQSYGPVLSRQSNSEFSNQIISLDGANPGTAKIIWRPYDVNSNAITGNTSPGNGWNHIAIVYSSGDHKLYLNGALDGSGTETGAMGNNFSVPLAIGAWIGDGDGFGNADIDEVRIWNVMKTQPEIQASMNCELPSGTPGLIANYHFNQGIAEADNTGEITLNDASENANNGTLYNFALNGSSSNWVAPGGVISGTVCNQTCIVNIPDANFKAALVANPSINTNGNTEIECTEAASYTGTIDVSGLGIYDLTGIEAFTALTNLDCNFNNLTSLDVSNSPSLLSLSCSTNQITNLNVSNNALLQILFCEQNQISSLNLLTKKQLEGLYCGTNQLTSLDLSSNHLLTGLSCGWNPLTSLNLDSNPALSYLEFSTTNITSIDLQAKPNLTYIGCIQGQLTSLDVSSSPLLTSLNCQTNAITSLHLSANPLLASLTCHTNQLTNLDLSANHQLTSLGCEYNPLLTTVNIQNGNNSNMTGLDLINNPSLSCIQVDNVANANSYSGWRKDATANYSTNCATNCQPTTSSTTYSACNSYLWNGNTYFASGTYTYLTINAEGCDSTALIVLTITPSSTNTTAATATNSYTWSVTGQTYYASGTYTGPTVNCVTEVLSLTLTSSNSPVISSFTPLSGSVGTLVTITGTDLGTPTSFTIGGVTAIVVSNTGTTLVGMVMPGAVTGTVSVTTANGTATSGSNFTVTPTPYPSVQQGNKLVGTGATGSAYQGYSVSVSADGNTAIVGGIYDNAGIGAAWIYTRNGSIWTQQGNKLIGTGAIELSTQGSSVSLSADGNTAIVGGYGDNTTIGAAWVYTRSGGIWTQQGNKLVGTGAIGYSNQGISVSLSADGNMAIVGGYNDNSGLGAAWVYTRSGGIWTQQGNKLVGTGAIGQSSQGSSVSLSADGNTAIVGGNYDNSYIGAAWVYTRSGGIWTQQGNKLVGTGATGYASQGYSVSLSADGNTAIVGGIYDNTLIGAAWVYTRSGGIWTQQGNKLVGTGAIWNSKQGISVSLSADGNTAIVGGHYDYIGTGATWVYTRNGGIWTQQGNKLVGTGGDGDTYQGFSVSLSSDGNTAIVGGYLNNYSVGAAWVFIATAAPTDLTWTGTNSTYWNTAGNWSPNGIPMANQNLTIPSLPSNQPHVTSIPGTPAVCNNLTIESGAILTIDAGKALTVNGTLTNITGNTGLVIESGGSLIESSGAAATVESAIVGNKWHFISSPVTGPLAVSGMFLGKYLQNHTESTNAFTDITSLTQSLSPMKGFALWGDAAGFTAQYKGPLNTGVQSITVNRSAAGVNKGWNLIGNPYPSVLNWNAVTKSNLNTAIYIEDGGNWAIYNSGVGVPNSTSTQYIAPGQGFFVQVLDGQSSGTISMTLGSRVHNSTTFFKNSEEIVPDLVRLEVSGNGYKDEAVVRLNPEATADFDGDWDAHKFYSENAEAPQIYTLGATPLAINTFRELAVVPVGVKATSGTYTIAATEINDLQNVKLEDTKTGIFTELAMNSYTFNFTTGENEQRFVLHFDMLNLGLNDPGAIASKIYSYHKAIYIDMLTQASGTVFIYNVAGQLIKTSTANKGLSKVNVPTTGIYIVKLISGNATVVKKVWIE